MPSPLRRQVDELTREVADLRRVVSALTVVPVPTGPFTPERAAYLAGKTPATIRKLAKRGAPWARQVGGRWLIDRVAFMAWVSGERG